MARGVSAVGIVVVLAGLLLEVGWAFLGGALMAVGGLAGDNQVDALDRRRAADARARAPFRRDL